MSCVFLLIKLYHENTTEFFGRPFKMFHAGPSAGVYHTTLAHFRTTALLSPRRHSQSLHNVVASHYLVLLCKSSPRRHAQPLHIVNAANVRLCALKNDQPLTNRRPLSPLLLFAPFRQTGAESKNIID